MGSTSHNGWLPSIQFCFASQYPSIFTGVKAMTESDHIIGASRRHAIQKMMGLALPAGIMGAKEIVLAPGLPRQTGVVAPPHLSKALAFQPSKISGLFDVRAFGAKGDGAALDTPPINRAIEAASRDGGTVLLPAGTYLCYSLRLKSNVSLYLDQGATILAADPPSEGSGGGYDPPEPNPWDQYQDFGHSHFQNSLIWGIGIQNVSILGPGLIWGKGLRTSVGHRGYPGLGDKTIALKSCNKVTLRDFSILQGGHFGILATGVNNLTIENLLIDTNRDGMDIDCCHNVRVSNCTVNSPWDDGICPKSSYALGERRATEDVTISNCMVTGGYEMGTVLDGTFKRFDPSHRVPRTGRIKCGTESSGGFRNITISNCIFDHSQGLALETVDGALLEDISISNITMRHIVNLPIFMRLGRRMRAPQGTAVGKLRRVNISNLIVESTSGRYASILTGLPGHAIEDVKLSNIYILSEGGGSEKDAAIEPAEKEKGYPEPTMFGPMPAYGFFIRHVKGIQMASVEVSFDKQDLRPAWVLDDVEGADFIHIKAKRAPQAQTFALKNIRNFNLYISRPLAETHIESADRRAL
jgi:polygalacturonase